jgi:hypothetical protein
VDWEWQEKKREMVDWEWGVAEVEGEGEGEREGEEEEEGAWERIQSAAASGECPPVAASALVARSREKPMLRSCSMTIRRQKLSKAEGN